MDKFLVPIDKNKKFASSSIRGEKRFRQAKIQNLKGVVNVDEILRIKTLLRAPNQSIDVLSKCLNNLSQKIPSSDVLKSTKLARTVQKLENHEDASIATKAKGITATWTTFYKEKFNKPKIDVACDHETRAARQMSTSRIKNALSGDLDVESLHQKAENIEREVFMRHKMIRKSYSLLVRKIIHELEKDEDDLKARVLRGSKSCRDLVDELDVYKK